jgi:hypothetical protein
MHNRAEPGSGRARYAGRQERLPVPAPAVRNVAEVNGKGFGFFIHDAEESNNTVRCDNRVEGAASGYANIPCA